MAAPAAKNDGMGSLLYANGTCRFRVWAPFAQRVQVMGDFIRGLGFNAIELLPISDTYADACGAGEGYGPSDMFAPEDMYATRPDYAVAELLQLIDAAHSKGLAVILDVVYNHAAI